ncbi:MAG: D-amino-acid oxidase, partial [Acidimicrobiales bacterium]|nr:D-amino-acid oxidase [Acidimicrobiales bacterium]
SAIALALVRAGARVTLADPAADGTNASAIAAGMLAPAFEAALDPMSAGHFELYRDARDRWPGFIADLAGAKLWAGGARFLGDQADCATLLAQLGGFGAAAEADGGSVFTPEDWRLEPQAMLAAMQRRFVELGGIRLSAAVTAAPAGETLVLACGFASLDLAPELAWLSPIKGQLLRFDGGPAGGPILRDAGGYLVPSEQGAVVGATMQPGVSNPGVDSHLNAGLLATAAGLSPELATTPYRARAGVRAATPDGLPLVGPSVRPGVWLAAGARRNGWLLAPLIAEIIVERLAGGSGGPAAALFDPARFDA